LEGRAAAAPVISVVPVFTLARQKSRSKPRSFEALTRADGGRLSGVRYSVGYDADPTIGNSRPDSPPHVYAQPEIRAGVARLAAHGQTLGATIRSSPI
jgi:hypothetical protein